MATLTSLIFSYGYIGLFLVIFAESGFLLGFFLPGDSLLFTAGILAAGGHFNIWILIPLCIAAAIGGDSFGYAWGNKFGPKIFKREDSLLFKKEYVERTKKFYEKYGKKTIIMARFVPVVRTFAPIFAGVGEMPYKTFISYNVVGGLFWPTLFLGAGYFLGQIFPNIERYLTLIVLFVAVVSFVPIVNEFLKHRKDGI